MITSEVQRTLVKSPPELWTELSDPASLARHLGEFGEIRITRVEPETSVEWEAEGAAGSVSIKPSGWGTRVTLRATRETSPGQSQAEPQPPAEPEPAAEAAQAAEPEIAAQSEPGPPLEVERGSPKPEPEPEPQPEPAELEQTAPEAAPGLAEWGQQAWGPQPEPESRLEAELQARLEAEPEPEPPRGLLARLFGRRRRWAAERQRFTFEDDLQQPGGDEEPPPAVPAPLVWAASGNELQAPDAWPQGLAEAEPFPHPFAEPAADPLEAGEPQAPAPPEDPEIEDGPAPPADPSAELGAVGEAAEAEVTAVLSAMLDRLGTAHHRPFSRG